MVKKIHISVIFILLLITNILAASTNIHIDTLPNKRLFIQYLKTGEVYTIVKDSTLKNTSSKGEVLISESFSVDYIDLKMALRDDSGTILNDKVTNIKTGGNVYISFTPGHVGIIEKNETAAPTNQTSAINQTNITVQNQTTQENTTLSNVTTTFNQTNETKEISPEKTNNSITGFSIKEKLPSIKINWKIVGYSAGIILIILVLGAGIVIFVKKRPKTFNSKVYFAPKTSRADGVDERSLREAEKRIKEAQEEIQRIKSRDEKIKEAERRVEQDKQELERLKRGRF